MSSESIIEYLNGTSLNEKKNETTGISFFQTVLLTLFTITSVILFSALAYYLVKKRAFKKMRHHLVPLYHFDPGECDHWENEFLDGSVEGKRIAGHQPRILNYCNLKTHGADCFEGNSPIYHYKTSADKMKLLHNTLITANIPLSSS